MAAALFPSASPAADVEMVDYKWVSTTGGDLADGANWSQAGTAPGGGENARLIIETDQSAPLTLSKSLSVTTPSPYSYTKPTTFSFNGEMRFDTADTTLTLNSSYWRGNNKTFSFTRGVLDLGSHYFENGNKSVSNNRWTIDGAEATLKGGISVGVVSPNNVVVVTNGATASLSSLGLGRNCGNYDSSGNLVSTGDRVASNNVFRVTGAGSTLTVSDSVGMGVRSDNRLEIVDGATAVIGTSIRLGEWQYDAAAPELPHVFDRGSRILVSGKGSKLTMNPSKGYVSNKTRVTIGWNSSSNVLEIADGAEFVSYSNLFFVANYLRTDQGNANYNPVVITNRVPGYRFRGNRLRVTGKGSKMSFFGTSSADIIIANDNPCAEDNRIEVLDGGTFESVDCALSVFDGLDNGIYVGPGSTLVHNGANMYVGNSRTSTNAFFTVEGGTCTVNNGIVFNNLGWGVHFDALAGAKVTVGDGTSDTVSLGGKTDDGTRRNASINVAGADTAVTMGGTLNVNNDSILSFAVPERGFATTPLTVNKVVFGTACATPPTLRVTQAATNYVKYVTLVESANGIALPETLTLDLPEGATLVKAGEPRYDPKKITVRLRTDLGLAIIVR